MVDVASIRSQAANKYHEVVSALLAGGQPFPLPIRYGRIRPSWERGVIMRSIEALKGESVARLGYGLTIAWQTVDTRRNGVNEMPGDISFAGASDYFTYIRKTTEYAQVCLAADELTGMFPELRAWLPSNWRKLPLDGSTREFWRDLCNVVAFFRANPRPGVYVRELPVSVHTKFIETNSKIIEHLLRVVAPHAITVAETFEEGLGLKAAASQVECRLLDLAMRPDWPFRQLTVGIDDLYRFEDVEAAAVIVTENRTNFLTLPPVARALAFAGQGRAVSRLGRVSFLRGVPIWYWGDIDTHGFEILASLREVLPQTRSVMMDRRTFDRFTEYHVDGAKSQNGVERFLPFLAEDERELFLAVSSSGKRLEQEKIPQSYVLDEIARAAAR